MELIGYHGTAESVNRILDGNELKKKIFKYDALPGDLGTGTYFFKDDPALAAAFASKNTSFPVSIIEGNIKVKDVEVLDLNDSESLQFFNEFKFEMLDQIKKTFGNLKGNRDCIDGIVINLMVRLAKNEGNQTVKLVIRDTYTQTKDYSYEKNGWDKYFISNFPNGTELCVIDASIVQRGVSYNGI